MNIYISIVFLTLTIFFAYQGYTNRKDDRELSKLYIELGIIFAVLLNAFS